MTILNPKFLVQGVLGAFPFLTLHICSRLATHLLLSARGILWYGHVIFGEEGFQAYMLLSDGITLTELSQNFSLHKIIDQTLIMF